MIFFIDSKNTFHVSLRSSYHSKICTKKHSNITFLYSYDLLFGIFFQILNYLIINKLNGYNKYIII